jgi:hypothetical protein
MPHDLSRRRVLVWTGAATGLAVAGSLLPNFGITAALAADLGSGDVGILNYAYALEQLEAAFYTQVVANPYSGADAGELDALTDIRDHEVAHRDFLRKALGKARIPDLEVDFSKVDFSSRKSVLSTALTFENLGVNAYNGAGQLLSDAGHLAAAGTIVSVEARHAAAIADLLNPASAASVGRGAILAQGLDAAYLPSFVLPKVAPFVVTPVSANSLP